MAGFALALLGCSAGDGRTGTSATPEPTTTLERAEEIDSSWGGEAASWALETFGDFEPVSESGHGPSILDLPADIRSAKGGIIRITYAGSGPMVMQSLDTAGEPEMILLDTSFAYNTADPGSFEGETNWWGANQPPHQLDIDADGSWTIDIHPLHQLPALPETGEGVRSYLYDGPGGEFSGSKPDLDVGLGMTEVTPCLIPCEWGGSINNVVAGSSDPAFSGTLSAGPSWVIITHRGTWEMTLPE